MRDVPESYSLKDSYEKERKLQLAQRQNEELYGFFPPEGWDSLKVYKDWLDVTIK